jgi:putative membrane protein
MGIHENLRASRLLLIAALLAAALSGCSAKRQQPDATASAAAAQPSAQPTASEAKAKPARAVPSAEASTKRTSGSVLAQIHQANLKEIELGKIAEEKASTDEVRAYAVQLVNDHTSADQLVLATAQKTGAHLRDASTARSKLTDKKLSTASGAQFDRTFLEQTSADHKKLMSELQQEREDASDDNIESLIDKLMPILQQHHDLSQILLKKEQALAGPSQNHG